MNSASSNAHGSLRVQIVDGAVGVDDVTKVDVEALQVAFAR
jgi:hypothetical protein